MYNWLPILSLSNACLLGALVLNLLVCGKWAVHMVYGKARWPRWVEGVFVLAAIVAIGVLVVDALRWVDLQPLSSIAPLPALAAIGVGLVFTRLHLRAAALRLPAGELRQRPLAWVVLAASAALGCWSSYRFQCVMQPLAADLPLVKNRAARLEREPQFVGISDQGREIPLFRSATEPVAAVDAFHPANGDPLQRMQNGVIVRDDPDNSSNCHGWVFTGGEFLLDVAGIRTILEDNGYEPSDNPQSGDVIVYYHSPGAAAHTGVVSAVLTDGTVIIESKWGVEGRFLHRPDDQPYAQSYTYYRSKRSGHEITIRETAGSSSLAKERLPRKRPRRA